MNFTHQTDPNILIIKRGNYLFIVLGLPFLLVGIGFSALALGVGNVGGESLPLPIGVLFGAIGAAFVFGSAGVRIDMHRRSIEKWWGIFGINKTSHYNVQDYSKVTLTKEVRRGNRSNQTVYPVRLTGSAERTSLTIKEERNAQSGRRLGEQIAKLVRLPLTDSTGGSVITREHDELDISISDAARQSSEQIEIPNRPSNMSAKVTDNMSAVVIDFAASGFQLRHKLILGAILLFVVMNIPLFLIPILSMEDASGGATIFMGFIAVMFLLPLLGFSLWALNSAKKTVRVEASRAGLKVTTTAPFGSKTIDIPNNELEEFSFTDRSNIEKILKERISSRNQAVQSQLNSATKAQIPSFLLSFLGHSTNITAKSDNHTVSFGQYLPDDEVGYIYAILKKALVG